MTRRRSHYNESCWRDRTCLELALITFVFIAVVFTLTLVLLLTINIPFTPPKRCDTSECIYESIQISKRIDPTVHPCDDFYKFACGTFTKNAHGDETQGAYRSLQTEVERQLLEIYSEVSNNSHPAVALAQKLFRTCMSEKNIEQESLKIINEVIRILGGWPVVEGYWDETKFDWIQATYRLRELGLPFDTFLDLLVVPDPQVPDKFIYEVAIPTAKRFFSTADFERKHFMTEIAVNFHAIRKHADNEMLKVVELYQELQKKNYSLDPVAKQHRRYTVYEFHKMFGHYINWIEFINKIAYPAPNVDAKDTVIFPQIDILNNWLHLLSKTPKRIQANYIVWRVIEELMPYLPSRLQDRKLKQNVVPHLIENNESRLQFCFREVQQRFYPSPINILYARRYLNENKIGQIEEITENIKQEFLAAISTMQWLDDADKTIVVDKIKSMAVTLGAPDGYKEDDIFDNIIVDLKPAGETVIEILMSVNRNYQTLQFFKVNQSRSELEENKWFSGTFDDYLLYDILNNILRIPSTMLQSIFFKEDRPKYFNYGAIGTSIAYELVGLLVGEAKNFDKFGNPRRWSDKTIQSFENKTKCIILDLEYFNGDNTQLSTLEVRQMLALKVSYKAYQKRIDNYEEENHLLGSKYTPKQIFWMAAAFTYCQPISFYDSIFKISEDVDYSSFMVFGPIRNNLAFGEDFNCPKGSLMNPQDKCAVW